MAILLADRRESSFNGFYFDELSATAFRGARKSPAESLEEVQVEDRDLAGGTFGGICLLRNQTMPNSSVGCALFSIPTQPPVESNARIESILVPCNVHAARSKRSG